MKPKKMGRPKNKEKKGQVRILFPLDVIEWIKNNRDKLIKMARRKR